MLQSQDMTSYLYLFAAILVSSTIDKTLQDAMLSASLL
jgi:hypothetical protein